MNVFYPGDQILNGVIPQLLPRSPLKWANLNLLWSSELSFVSSGHATLWIPSEQHSIIEKDSFDVGTNLSAANYTRDIRRQIQSTLDANKLRWNMEYIVFFMGVLDFIMNSHRELGSEISIENDSSRGENAFRKTAIYWDDWLPLHANSDLVRSAGAISFNEFTALVASNQYGSVFTADSLQKGQAAIGLLKNGWAYTHLPLQYASWETAIWTAAGNGRGWSVRIWQDASHGFTTIEDTQSEVSPLAPTRVGEVIANLRIRLNSLKSQWAADLPDDLEDRLQALQQLGLVMDYLWSSPLALQISIDSESPYAKLPIPRFNRAYQQILWASKTQLDTWIAEGTLFSNVYGSSESKKVKEYMSALSRAAVGSWYNADFTLLNELRLNWERVKLSRGVTLGVGSTHLTSAQKEEDRFNDGGWANSSIL